MWPYPVMGQRRRSSSEAGPSNSPTSPTRSPSTYPPELYEHHYDPRTPSQQHRSPLGRVDESPNTSTGSRAPIVARDYADEEAYYAASPGSITDTYRSSVNHEGERAGTMTSDSELEGTMSSRRDTVSIPPDPDPVVRVQRMNGGGEHRMDLIPPVSIHDAYLSKHITPLVPDSTKRPTVPRSTSVPVTQNSLELNAAQGGGGGLLPPINVEEEGSGKAKPIFEIFDAGPGEGGRNLERRLRGHLKDVLKVQEEIGKMHLALEGIGLGEVDRMNMDDEAEEQKFKGVSKEESEEDSLSRRERGVEALMEKLGTLSNTLRTYHDLGTPRLQFPSDRKKANAGLHSDTALPSPSPPPMNRQQSAFPAIAGSSTLHAEPAPLSPPPRNKVIDNLIGSEGGGERTRKTSTNSDLPPLRLPLDDYERSSGGLREKPSSSFGDLVGLRREERNSWDEHGDVGYMSARHSAGAGERRKVDYALKEPVDRTRAW